MGVTFEVLLLEDAFEFIASHQLKIRKKILQNLRLARFQRNSELFKKLGNEIWEFRTRYAGNQYRLLAFWDKSSNKRTLVVATHGFIKKTSKVDQNEIRRALEIRAKYFESKKE